jgi:hypothetical protein
MKRLLLVLVLAVALTGLLAAPGAATACPRAHQVLVMNVSYRVVNDESPGSQGFWALQDYTRYVQVWRMPDGSFSWTSQFVGRWTTFAGALSPGAGIAQVAGGSGMFMGVLNGTFTSSSYIPVCGYLGMHDFGGTEADVLSTSGQTGTPASWSPADTYFPGAAADGWSTWVTSAWSYTYRYGHQTFVNDFLAQTAKGDIITK